MTFSGLWNSGVRILLNFLSFKFYLNSLCTYCSVLHAYIYCVLSASVICLLIISTIHFPTRYFFIFEQNTKSCILYFWTPPAQHSIPLCSRIGYWPPPPLCVNNVHHPLQISPILSRAGHMYVLYVSSKIIATNGQ